MDSRTQSTLIIAFMIKMWAFPVLMVNWFFRLDSKSNIFFVCSFLFRNNWIWNEHTLLQDQILILAKGSENSDHSLLILSTCTYLILDCPSFKYGAECENTCKCDQSKSISCDKDSGKCICENSMQLWRKHGVQGDNRWRIKWLTYEWMNEWKAF